MFNLEIKYCPSSLKSGFNTYSSAALRLMFDGKKVSHILDFESPNTNENVAELLRQNAKTISVSGAQFKQSLLLEKNKLRLTNENEQGQYILKPIPFRPPFGSADQIAANEHLTMQIAKQIYGIKTAECALIFFENAEPAYITKRFDNVNGEKIAQEDFASIAGFSNETNGEQYRGKGSYEDIANLMKKYVAAYPIEIEKFFVRVLFNFVFSNGDAHLKNFSLQQTSKGDYVLSPAYDLLNTTIHIPNDSFFALSDGLFSGDYETDSFKALGFYAYDDFFDFGIKIGLIKKRLVDILSSFGKEKSEVRILINASYLNDATKFKYENCYLDRLKMIKNSFSGKNK